jgi:methylaspartate mutase sigma subunit
MTASLRASDWSRSPANRRDTVVLTGVSSDAHTWNLVFLQLLLEELGYHVVNLGCCVPEELPVAECLARRPVLLVVSSVNGHGYQDGMALISRLRAQTQLRELSVVIGGKLGIAGAQGADQLTALIEAGYDAVFDDGAQGIASFRRLLGSLPRRALLP